MTSRACLIATSLLAAGCGAENPPRGAAARPPEAAQPRVDTAAYNDSVRWAAAEAGLMAQRTATMQRYDDCLAGLRDVRAEMRPRLEAACRRLPSAPR